MPNTDSFSLNGKQVDIRLLTIPGTSSLVKQSFHVLNFSRSIGLPLIIELCRSYEREKKHECANYSPNFEYSNLSSPVAENVLSLLILLRDLT